VAKKVWQEKCGRKIAEEKVWKEKYDRKRTVEKSQQEKCDRKKCDKKTTTKNVRQQNATRRKMYGFHMCSVELMNIFEGFPCKYVGFPLGSLGFFVEWF
jgi:hypothetical protein